MSEAQVSLDLSQRLVFRRPEDFLFPWVGEPAPAWAWWPVTALVLLAGIAVVVFFYRREAQSIGTLAATGLGCLRGLVYLILAWAFLLPAWEESVIRTETRQLEGRILVLFDTSGSMTRLSDGAPGTPTRQDLVLSLLNNKGKWIDPLLAKGSIDLYRFGRFLDEKGLRLGTDGIRSLEEIQRAEAERRKIDEARTAAEEARLTGRIIDSISSAAPSVQESNSALRPLSPALWTAWLKPGTDVAAPPEWDSNGRDWLAALIRDGKTRLSSDEFGGTNPTDAVARLLERDDDPMIQGLVVVTDGRSTEPSVGGFDRVTSAARARGVPVLVVGVGEDRKVKQTRTDIVDVRVPPRVEPEDRFRIAFEATGSNRAGETIGNAEASLEITRVRRKADGTEEPLDIMLEEPPPPVEKGVPSFGAASEKPRELINLGRKVTLPYQGDPVRFDDSNPPRVEVGFIVDADAIGRAAGRDEDLKKKRWEIAETKDSELRIVARLKKPAGEPIPDMLTRGPARLKVERRPLRVLFVAGAAGREYQFLRTLFSRETEKKRAQLSILLQLPPGSTSRRPNIVQDVPKERMLESFPAQFTPTASESMTDPTNLASFDSIVMFDPDWNQINAAQLANLRQWVDNGGGLIVVAGPVNILALARPGNDQDKLKPILDLLPVRPRDSRIDASDRQPDSPWPLIFDAASPELDFLRLSDDPTRGVERDWTDFFEGSTPKGFFSFYPVDEEKRGAMVVGRFGDPRAALRSGKKQPWLVVTAPASGRRVVWLGSDETWRLRMYQEAYHERFWTKLVRWSASGGKTRIIPYLRNPYRTDKAVEFEVKIEDRSGQPLVLASGRSDGPRVALTAPEGVAATEYPAVTALEPVPGRKGMFRAALKLSKPGAYEAIIEVPATKDRSTSQFVIVDTPPDPESRDPRPDLEAWRSLASPLSAVRERIDPAEYENVLAALLNGPEVGDAKRLVFPLAKAEALVSCFRPEKREEIKRLPGITRIEDLWDRGLVLASSTWLSDRPLKIPYLLLAVVGILGLEWSLRKLARLA